MSLSKEERDQILEELKEQYPILEQTKFNEFNISDKLQENTQLYTKYKELYDQEKFVYNQLEEKMEVLKGQRYDYYRFDYDRNLQKTEIEQYYLPKDPKILKMKKLLEKQKIKVDFFSLCLQGVNNLYWRIKAYLDNEKL